MMLAGIRDYLRPWQLPFFFGFAVIWLVGGMYLTRWALRRLGQSAAPKPSPGRCALINLLANGAGLAAMCITTLFVAVLATRVGPRSLGFGAIVLGPVAMLGMSWLVYMAMLSQDGRQLLPVAFATAGPLALLLLVTMVGTFTPVYYARQHQAKVGRCARNLTEVATALEQYSLARAGERAQSLQALVEEGWLKPAQLRCPGRPELQVGYLYQPSKLLPRRDATNRIHACDRAGNHPGQRLILRANGSLTVVSEAEFQRLLALPENAQLARIANE